MTSGRHSYVNVYPSDLKAGTARLKPMTRLIYLEICLEIWDTGEPVSPGELTLMFDSIRGWRKHVDSLCEAGKLSVNDDGSISQERALNSAKEAIRAWENKAKAGRKGAKKRWETQGSDSSAIAAPRQDDGSVLQNQNHSKEDRADALSKKQDQIRQAVNRWNDLAEHAGLSRCMRLSASRKAKIWARLRDAGGVDGWEAALQRIAKTPNLLGANKDGWRVSLDTLLRESFFIKLMEGGFERSDPKQTSGVAAKERGSPQDRRMDAFLEAGRRRKDDDGCDQ